MNEQLTALVQLLDDFDTAMLVTEQANGELVSRPMSVQEPRPDRALWFVTSTDTASAQNVAGNTRINLTFHRKTDHAWVSISGKAVINGDRILLDSLWKSDWEIWFPQGKATPNIVLLDIIPERIDFWEPAHGKIGTLFQMAKAAVTDTSPDLPPTQTLRVSDLELAGAMNALASG
jgi:general stress protein 26